MMTVASKARLSIHEPPVGHLTAIGAKIIDVDFQFDPDQVVVTAGSGSGAVSGSGSGPGSGADRAAAPTTVMSLTVFMDAATTPAHSTLPDQVKTLLKCGEVTTLSILSLTPDTPLVVVRWGELDAVDLVARVQRATAVYTHFTDLGAPVRAKVDLTIREIPSWRTRYPSSAGGLVARTLID
jgi:hypothetical protein